MIALWQHLQNRDQQCFICYNGRQKQAVQRLCVACGHITVAHTCAITRSVARELKILEAKHM